MTTLDLTPEDFGVQANMVFIQFLPISGKIYSDQIGRSPVTYNRGRKYIMLMVDYYSDAILAYPLSSRADTELLRTVNKLYQDLTVCVLQPLLHMLENERSTLMKYFIWEEGSTHQLVSPGL